MLQCECATIRCFGLRLRIEIVFQAIESCESFVVFWSSCMEVVSLSLQMGAGNSSGWLRQRGTSPRPAQAWHTEALVGKVQAISSMDLWGWSWKWLGARLHGLRWLCRLRWMVIFWVRLRLVNHKFLSSSVQLSLLCWGTVYLTFLTILVPINVFCRVTSTLCPFFSQTTDCSIRTVVLTNSTWSLSASTKNRDICWLRCISRPERTGGPLCSKRATKCVMRKSFVS